jgi:general secretion pathway protein E
MTPATPQASGAPATRLLGEVLADRVSLDPAHIERALRLQEDSGERLGGLLVRLGLIAERDLADALAEQLGLDVVGLKEYPDAPVAEDRISPEFLQRALAVPLSEDAETLSVALADPLDSYTVEALRMATGRRIVSRVGVISEIESAIRALYREGSSAMDEAAGGLAEGNDDEDIEHLKDLASEAPVVRLVNLLISRALEARASDIHIEPFDRLLKVRFRVDGVLREVEAPPVRSTAAVVSRVKIMARLNIAERRLPQDGRIQLRVAGREIDLRVSTVPTMHGESVVMRILDQGRVPLDFESLGYRGEALRAFRAMLDRPHGVILLTGPTGSGKTTTLYAALQILNSVERKILTVEDPVEYQLEGINQIQVRPSIGLTFAGALRSILRQDPDVVMIGEMRDVETARIAVQAALTGHKVFSTLHTNDASSSVTRLLDMGVEDYLLTSTINGIVAQRLVRTLCAHCKAPVECPPELERFLAARGMQRPDHLVYDAAGCERCEGTGFRGRTGILELLVMSDPVRRAILEHGDAEAIREAAMAQGMRSMRDDGIAKVLAGLTRLEEVERVTQAD